MSRRTIIRRARATFVQRQLDLPVRILQNTYSVPSRLIGMTLTVRVRAETLELYIGASHILSLPHLKGCNQHRLDYRHLIWSLVRKPGAISAYRYREELFPTTVFRRAYNALVGFRPEMGELEYLRVLHLAASTHERDVEGAFLAGAVNVIAIGEPGTGKSHLTAALGHELVQRKRSVFWTPTFALVQHLLAAKRDLRLPRELAKLDRIECLVLDDIGYVQQDRKEMEVLFTLLASRYERSSTVISTNLAFSEWNQIFKNPMTTAAAIDRVIHHSIILDLVEVESYRVMEAEAEAQKKEKIAEMPAGTPKPANRNVMVEA